MEKIEIIKNEIVKPKIEFMKKETKFNIIKLGILALIPIITLPYFFLLCGYTVDMLGQMLGMNYVEINELLFIKEFLTPFLLLFLISPLVLIYKVIKSFNLFSILFTLVYGFMVMILCGGYVAFYTMPISIIGLEVNFDSMVKNLSTFGGHTPIGYVLHNFSTYIYQFMFFIMLLLVPFFIKTDKESIFEFDMRNWIKFWVNLSVAIYIGIFAISGYSYIKDPSSFMKSYNDNYGFVVPLTTDLEKLKDHLLHYDMRQKVGELEGEIIH